MHVNLNETKEIQAFVQQTIIQISYVGKRFMDYFTSQEDVKAYGSFHEIVVVWSLDKGDVHVQSVEFENPWQLRVFLKLNNATLHNVLLINDESQDENCPNYWSQAIHPSIDKHEHLTTNFFLVHCLSGHNALWFQT